MRPIPKSDSCNTLVDVTEIQHKFDDDIDYFCSGDETIETHLMLPSDDFIDIEQRLYLPAATLSSYESPCNVATQLSIDECLRNIPNVYVRNDELLNQPHRVLSSSKDNVSSDNNERILNVFQGEVAHATSSQCDVIASDNATTCHILAMRSTLSDRRDDGQTLASLAHIDRPGYEDCVRDMIKRHKSFHRDAITLCSDEIIDMDVHIMGGFNDADGSSREISSFLMDLLVRLSEEECCSVRMTLRTCAISCMNDDGQCSPIGRGLAVNVATGECFLATVDNSAVGPAAVLRNARLWSRSSSSKKRRLSLMHDVRDSNDGESRIVVEPFMFHDIRGSDILLRLPDCVLLQHTSTSPEVEKDDFCDVVRKTLRFMKYVDCKNVFGQYYDEAVVFQRQPSGNMWGKI
eukprot:CAMPEP_0172500018 /NCGR_PEP_ID=MMETSP1066-20121228/133525_1 /TAXON_ID=671091 /ORGANISM="Coscinodiscus wailesii, Strain CCMP2513" /LENGTH=404 /DNA_ID=CAMNT_0013274057 /DNA_START=22 /DNA_END=1236 /DNA_ORIENTATION=-